MKLQSKSHIKMGRDELAFRLVTHIFIIFLCILCLYPFLIIVGSSFESQTELTLSGYKVWPVHPTLEAYQYILAMPKRLLDGYYVTTVTTIAYTLIGLYLCSSFGYVISRRDYPYRRGLSFYAFFTMLFNGGLVPTYILVSQWLHMKDSLWALILPGAAGAWHMLMFKTFFMSIPTSLIESAKLDGAGETTIFCRIVIPISKPSFACIGLFLLLASWNAWYPSLLYIDSSNKVQLQYMLMSLLRNIEFLNSPEAAEYGMNMGMTTLPQLNARMAMCTLAMGPIILVFPFFQKYFVRGLTVGSVKG